MNDELERELSFPLDFLKEGLSYEATLYEDAPGADGIDNPESPYNIRKETVKSTDTLTVQLARCGGFAISFKEL